MFGSANYMTDETMFLLRVLKYIWSLLVRLVPILALTCLIWIYADQISTDQITEVIRIRIDAEPGSPVIPVLNSGDKNDKTDTNVLALEVTFQSQRSRLTQLQRELKGLAEIPWYVKVDTPDAKTLIQPVPDLVTKLMKDYPWFAGVVVVNASPENIKVALDRYVTKSMPIQVLTGTVKTTTPLVEPAQIDVKIRASQLAQLRLEEQKIVIDLQDQLGNRPEMVDFDDSVPVPQEIAGIPIVIAKELSQVRVTLKIERREKRIEYRIPVTRIEVLGPPEILEKFRVEIEEQPAMRLELRGPASVMDNLKPDTIIPYIRVSADDITQRTFFPQQVGFLMPDERIVIDTRNVPSPVVGFRLVEKLNVPTKTTLSQ